MKIELLVRRRFVGRAEVDDVLRTAALRKGAGVFDVGVPGRRELTIKVDTCLAGQIAACAPWVGHMTENIPATVQLFGREWDQGNGTVGS